MSTAAMEKAKADHASQVEANRAGGVVTYDSGRQRQSDAIFEVTEGRHRLPDGQVLTPGKRFHPLERQITGGKRMPGSKDGRSTLEGKAREITATERRGVGATKVMAHGADFREMGLRALSMTNHAFNLADSAGLSAEDFEGIEPAHEQGYTKGQVEDIIAQRNQS